MDRLADDGHNGIAENFLSRIKPAELKAVFGALWEERKKNERLLPRGFLSNKEDDREQEFIFIPQRLADRLKGYISKKDIQTDQKIFPICYEAAREMIAKAGSVVGIHLRPHDLRRHAATYANRFCVPIEIAPKVILRHSNLSTTEISWENKRCGGH